MSVIGVTSNCGQASTFKPRSSAGRVGNTDSSQSAPVEAGGVVAAAS